MSAEFDFLTPDDKPALMAINTAELADNAKAALDQLGYKVHAASNHGEFLHKFAQTPYQVVVLEDEEADEGAATVARKGSRGGAAGLIDEDEGADLEEMLGEGEEELEGEAPVRAPIAPAVEPEWGLLPVLTLVPTALLMFIVGLMSFELIHGMWGYRQPYKVSGAVVKTFSGIFGAELPKD